MATEQALRELLQRVARDHKWDKDSIHIEPITSGGANYTSTLFLASASAAGREDKLFAKVAIIGEEMRAKMNGNHFFEVENYVYNDLLKIYRSLEDEHKLTAEERLYFPKLYTINTEQLRETVVLEDLTASGYSSYDRIKPVTWEYAAQATIELAKWHALSMAYEAQYPEEFAKGSKFLEFQMPEETPEATEAFKQLVAGTMAATRADNLPVMQAFLPDMMTAYANFNHPVTHPVLAHGDYRVSNLMHRRRNGKLQIVPVDYQTVHMGCPASDLVYFIFTGTDQAFRRLHYKNLIEFYYRQLGSSLKRLGLDIATTYPRSHFDEDLKTVLPYVMMLGTVVLPIVLVDAENAPDLSGNFDSMAIKITSLYSDRLNGIIDDLVDWGVLKR